MGMHKSSLRSDIAPFSKMADCCSQNRSIDLNACHKTGNKCQQSREKKVVVRHFEFASSLLSLDPSLWRTRLAYKSSSKSGKRCLVPCLEAWSAIVRARASEHVARASESSTCFPCWKSNQVTLFWRELFRVRSRHKVSIITFPVSYNGSKAMFFLRSHGENHANLTLYHVSPVQENISLQCGGSTENAA